MDTEAAAVWGDPDAPAVCLLTLGVDRHPETAPLPGGGKHLLCLNWTVQTWVDEVTQDTGAPPHPRNVARLGAALARMTNPDDFLLSQSGFTDVIIGLASGWFDNHRTGRHASVEELVVGLVEAHLITPTDKDERFSPAVVRLVNATAKQEGYGRLPKILKSLGIHADPAVGWGADLSADPDLAAVAAAGYDGREADLDALAKNYVVDVANRLVKLPLRRLSARKTADELAAFATR